MASSKYSRLGGLTNMTGAEPKSGSFLPALFTQALALSGDLRKVHNEKKQARRRQRAKEGFKKRAKFELNMHNPEHEEAYDYLKKLQMTRHDADLMYSAFREIDTDDSGSISRREFYSWSGLEQSPFTEAVFKVLDADESGEVDFKEFSLVLWNYLSFSLDTLAVFAFGLADVDDSGFLENREVLDLVRADHRLLAKHAHTHARDMRTKLTQIKLVYGKAAYESHPHLKRGVAHLGLDEEEEHAHSTTATSLSEMVPGCEKWLYNLI